MQVPTPNVLSGMAVDLLNRCKPGDSIEMEMSHGHEILKVSVKKEHPPAATPASVEAKAKP